MLGHIVTFKIRLVKNREAAAQFRHRQKAYMQKLEKHAEELTQSNIQVYSHT